MKKTNRDAKKLSIETTTVRKLDTELTAQQLMLVNGGQRDTTAGAGSSRAVC